MSDSLFSVSGSGYKTHILPSLSTLLKQSMIESSILNCISLCGDKPCILVISFSSVINAFKLDKLVSRPKVGRRHTAFVLK